ncbi:MAG TPA: hypothetical protein VIQ76_09695 [Propionibacteriaceae bacterium]
MATSGCGEVDEEAARAVLRRQMIPWFHQDHRGKAEQTGSPGFRRQATMPWRGGHGEDQQDQSDRQRDGSADVDRIGA